MALSKNITELIRELRKLCDSVNVPTDKAVNRIAIEELRRSYDIMHRAVDQLRVKTLTFIAATFGLLTFLYRDGDLFIPPQLYGRIFYFVGFFSLITALIIFLLGLMPYPWKLTTEIKQLKNIRQNNEDEYLEYVRGEYIDSFTNNARVYENKHSSFNLGFILLVVGAFTLIVIKTFPDSAKACYINKGTTCVVIQQKKGVHE